MEDDAVDDTPPDVMEVDARFTPAIPGTAEERVPSHLVGIVEVRIFKC